MAETGEILTLEGWQIKEVSYGVLLKHPETESAVEVHTGTPGFDSEFGNRFHHVDVACQCPALPGMDIGGDDGVGIQITWNDLNYSTYTRCYELNMKYFIPEKDPQGCFIPHTPTDQTFRTPFFEKNGLFLSLVDNKLMETLESAKAAIVERQNIVWAIDRVTLALTKKARIPNTCTYLS